MFKIIVLVLVMIIGGCMKQPIVSTATQPAPVATPLPEKEILVSASFYIDMIDNRAVLVARSIDEEYSVNITDSPRQSTLQEFFPTAVASYCYRCENYNSTMGDEDRTAEWQRNSAVYLLLQDGRYIELSLDKPELPQCDVDSVLFGEDDNGELLLYVDIVDSDGMLRTEAWAIDVESNAIWQTDSDIQVNGEFDFYAFSKENVEEAVFALLPDHVNEVHLAHPDGYELARIRPCDVETE